MSEIIRDILGSPIGYQDPNGTLRDKNRNKVGSIDKRDGTVKDASGSTVGWIDKDGQVRDRLGRSVGAVRQDGIVQDWQGVEIGTGSGAQLLLDLEKFETAPGFPRAPQPYEFKPAPSVRPNESAVSAHSGLVGILGHEGFVSPSVLGCLGLIAAVIVGAAIIFFLNNPSALPGLGKPTVAVTARSTPPPAVDSSAPATPAPAVNPTAEPRVGTVNADTLNVRKGPGLTFDIVSRLSSGTEVNVDARTQDSTWLKITAPALNVQGWVAAQYLDVKFQIQTLSVESGQ